MTDDTKALPADVAGLTLDTDELELVRQWYNAADDMTQGYLEAEDRALYGKILRALNWPIRKTVTAPGPEVEEIGVTSLIGKALAEFYGVPNGKCPTPIKIGLLSALRRHGLDIVAVTTIPLPAPTDIRFLIDRLRAEVAGRKIEVDVGAAFAALQASPELAAQMTELIGGPALIEAQTEIERLQGELAAGRTVAIADIAAERARQIEKEGWTPEHDDKHREGDMAFAAACYAIAGAGLWRNVFVRDFWRKYWPWAPQWWKPGPNNRRCLVKAGALIAAEIGRIDRAALTKGEG